MSAITEIYQTCELLLDSLGCELHALHQDQVAGKYVDGARRCIIEGLEVGVKLVMHQIDTLDAYDQSIEGINLADTELHQPEPCQDGHLFPSEHNPDRL